MRTERVEFGGPAGLHIPPDRLAPDATGWSQAVTIAAPPDIPASPASVSRRFWLIAGTPTDEPYPCRCSTAGRCNPRYCPCHGRTDVETMPTICCGRRALESRERRSHASPLGAA